VTFTDEDRTAIAELAPTARVVCIRPGVDPPPTASDPLGADPPRILFVGSFRHPPNIEAALRLALDVLPRVRERVPEARLEIVGDSPPRELRRLGTPHVRLTGRVPDVRPFLDDAAVVVAPLRLGGGMRVKVLDALAAGKALVATPTALAGLPVVPGEHALVAESDAELSEALVQLLTDGGRRGALGAAARAWALEELAWERAAAEYSALYSSLDDR
jgi:glycosyltransferase involved in cell wall biosynthesis